MFMSTHMYVCLVLGVFFVVYVLFVVMVLANARDVL